MTSTLWMWMSAKQRMTLLTTPGRYLAICTESMTLFTALKIAQSRWIQEVARNTKLCSSARRY